MYVADFAISVELVEGHAIREFAGYLVNHRTGLYVADIPGGKVSNTTIQLGYKPQGSQPG